ncbi:hypothetical protein B0T24DRAFT_562168 [Lasiosphaeria ovina]|uniref:Tyrosinase copper-binding domain-containing protein n=1 Tax=Lasiosphaeria ovina TaxID=92902 RepID=A0AAE0JTA2_9PEZI|nr:hypothetical protein B0T24DRAFT_562168 [Lasiosphaeria ovina]
MKPPSCLIRLLSLASLVDLALGGHSPDPEALAYIRVKELQVQYQKHIVDTIRPRKTGCTTKTILRRREWGSLPKHERLAYIDAVYCLANKTAQTPPSQVPGARSRYDDFVGLHIQQTLFVHSDGLFLPFHRHLVHLYERALRDECGFRGAQPYWDWTLSYKDPRNSSVLDGAPWSLGSNGDYIPKRAPTAVVFPGRPGFAFPPATGGGCVQSGPFTEDKFQVNLGPVGFLPVGPDGGYGYNPRCLARDLNPAFSTCLRPTNVTKLIDGCGGDLGCFNVELDIPGGLHSSGHFQMGGISLDIFASPADPVFWLHHAQIDRLWAIWQGQALRARRDLVWGTSTSNNYPPSDNITLDYPVTFGVFGPSKPVRELVSSIDGPHCYIYE